MNFSELKLIRPLLKAVEEQGYESPSPIQQKAIPPVLDGYDLLGCAQTGTGKTAAFALPILQQLAASHPNHKGVRALILTPTRELALQIDDCFAQYGKYLNVSHTVIFGGVGQNPQIEALKRGTDVLTACPGRLNDLIGQGHVDLSQLEIFVLDEADRMLDMGFVHDVKKVLRHLPDRRQNLLFSATMPREIEQLAAGILRRPVKVKVDPPSSTVDRIEQSVYLVAKADKKRLLALLLAKPEVKNALVFSRTKHGANAIAAFLQKQGVGAAAIHGNKSQTARVTALEDFKAGRIKALVATDIAARGIDISSLSHVFQLDLPEVPETYVHRIGRTGRAGAEGTAVSFCSPEEQPYLEGIEKLIRKHIRRMNSPELPPKEEAAARSTPEAEDRKREKTDRRSPEAVRQPAKVTAVRIDRTEMEESPMAENNQTPAESQSLSASAKRRRRRRRAAVREEQGSAGPSQQEKTEKPQRPERPQRTEKPQRSERPAKQQEEKPARTQKNPSQKGGQKPQQNKNQQAAARPQQPQSKERQNQPRNAQPQNKGQQKNSPAPVKNQPAPAKNQPQQAHSGRQHPQKQAQSVKKQPQPRPSAQKKAVDSDPGLPLISRRPPAQKFANFEAFLQARGLGGPDKEDEGEN